MGLSRSYERHMTLCDGTSGAHMTVISSSSYRTDRCQSDVNGSKS